jgi:hypothetical protein
MVRHRGAHSFAGVFGGVFLALPMHTRGALVVHLHAVHAEIALSGLGVARGDAGQGNEATAVFRPALKDGEVEERKVIALNDFLAGACRHRAREKLSCLGQQREHFQLVEEPLGRFHIHEHADAGRDFIVGGHADRHLHARVGAELVDQQLRAGVSFDILEQQGGATGLPLGVAAF